MDIHGYPRKNDMDMDMDMDGIFLIHGKPDKRVIYENYTHVLKSSGADPARGP